MMKHPDVIVCGYGSTPDRSARLAERYQAATHRRAVGIDYRTAATNPMSLAGQIHHTGIKVMVHSGGLRPVSEAVGLGALPEHVVAFAPPLPTPALPLAGRGIAIRLDDMAAAAIEQVEAKIGHRESVRDMERHPLWYIREIGRLAQFDTVAAAGRIAQSGAEVTIGLMKSDGLFNNRLVDPVSIEQLRSQSVGVKSLTGTHTRFTDDLGDMMREIKTAQDFDPDRAGDQVISLTEVLAQTIRRNLRVIELGGNSIRRA